MCRIMWYIFDSGVFLVKVVLCVGLYNYRLLERIFIIYPRNTLLFLFLKEIYICITIINIIIICISDVCDHLRSVWIGMRSHIIGMRCFAITMRFSEYGY